MRCVFQSDTLLCALFTRDKLMIRCFQRAEAARFTVKLISACAGKFILLIACMWEHITPQPSTQTNEKCLLTRCCQEKRSFKGLRWFSIVRSCRYPADQMLDRISTAGTLDPVSLPEGISFIWNTKLLSEFCLIPKTS